MPILYINSGGIPEYCDGFGEKFNPLNFETKLEEIIKNYEEFGKNDFWKSRFRQTLSLGICLTLGSKLHRKVRASVKICACEALHGPMRWGSVN